MTEIPEHLLKKAAAARAAKEGKAAPADDTAGAAPADSPGEAVAPAEKAAPAKKQEPLPTLATPPAAAVPDIPVVAAARNRKRVPYWAAPVLALLPLWGIVYLSAVQPPPEGEGDPLVIGAEVYSSAGCAGCHGADGGGGAGAQVNEGNVIQTFADPLDQVHWLAFGAPGGARDDGTYGDEDRPGGARNVDELPGVMAAYADQLSPEELGAVIMYMRSEFGGDLYDPEAEQGFTPEAFEEDPAAIVEQIDAVIELGETGDPELSEIDRGE